MTDLQKNGVRQTIDGELKVYYDGYWIKCYEAPKDNLSAKKSLIQSLTRRLFNHMEHGINIPGRLLVQVREAYEAETDPKKKRIKGAMLAGALFNRAADIFTHLVDLEADGVDILPGNDLMHSCGLCLQEALELGKLVKHRNGDEGIDELWGEPFKAFMMSVEDFYESRYVKIAMTMKNIDDIADYMAAIVRDDKRFIGLESLIVEFAQAARHKCETLRTDDDIFDIWSDFVVAGEHISEFMPSEEQNDEIDMINRLDMRHMLKGGIRLIASITRARVPMPKSTENYFADCEGYKLRCRC
ncbi:MAG: hypothetical protein HKP55_00015 [Gammaproteobacteria bacterium]|nr:hypothetical protein [Gammaproteobacteria bacterium]